MKIVFCLITLFQLSNLGFSQVQDSLMTIRTYWKNGQIQSEKVYSRYRLWDEEATRSFTDESFEITFWFPDGRKHRVEKFDFYIHKTTGAIVTSAWDKKGKATVVNGNGYLFDYYENGRVKEKGFIKDGYKDSLWTEYYENGKIKSDGNYLQADGYLNPVGFWKYCYDNGNIYKEGVYDVYGREDQNWTYYHRNKKMQSEQDGNRYYSAYDTTGKALLKNGNGFFMDYYPNGNIKQRIQLRDSLPDSLFNYYPDGKLQSIEKSRNDWFLSGYQLIGAWDTKGIQTASELEGWKYTYTENGNIYKKEYYRNGEADSLTLFYYPNDTLMKELYYNRNHDFFQSSLFYNNGKIANKVIIYGNHILNYSYEKEWWYNGNPKFENSEDVKREYYANGQLKKMGLKPPKDMVDESSTLNKSYYIFNESSTYTRPGQEHDGHSGGEPSLWNQSYYASGMIKSLVEYDYQFKSLMVKYFYPNGKLFCGGPIKYDSWIFKKPVEADSSYTKYFDGYLKMGTWVFYSESGSKIKEQNYEGTSYEERNLDEIENMKESNQK